MLNVVVIKWGTKFTSAHINILYRSVKANLSVPHNFVCFTDDPTNLDSEIITKPLWDNPFDLKGNYRKLGLYNIDILKSLDCNILLLDIDTVITGDITHLAKLKKNTLWKAPSITQKGFVYNTSLVRIVNTKYRKAWDLFQKDHTNLINSAKGLEKWSGTDQAIMSYLFGATSNIITEQDGIVSLRDHSDVCQNDVLPEWVRIVSFYHNSKYGDMSNENLHKKHPWLVEHWLSYADESDLEILKNSTQPKSRRKESVNERKQRIRFLLEKKPNRRANYGNRTVL